MQQINDTTYSIPGLGDRLTPPLITLGGKDVSKFAPNLNIGYDFGGGEEYYDNLNRTDKIISAKSEIKHNGKKVRLIEGSDIDEIYTDDLGRVKWDVVFEKCPETFTLEWRRTCSPGLTAHYQDSLENEWKQNPVGTLEEFLATNHRPDDVIGSYAIYCNKAHNWIRPLNRNKEIPADWRSQRAAGAELGDLNIAAYRDYKTGKVSHRYRPFVIDADGKTAWCTLLIIGNIERVTLPKDFMNSAKYPVTLDPTFGYTSVGATESSNGGSQIVYYSRSTCSDSFVGGSATAYVYGRQYVNNSVRVGIYDHLSYHPQDLLAASNVIVLGTSSAWCSAAITLPAISASTDYWTAMQLQTNVYTNYDSNGDDRYGEALWADGLPDPASGTSAGNKRYSVYIEYNSGGGGANGYYYMRNQ